MVTSTTNIAYRVSAKPPVRVESEYRSYDRTVRWLIVVASALSLLAYSYFALSDTTVLYKDAISHLQIARRVIDSPTTGLAQLGGVWLPLQHLLALPFIWIDFFYYSGFAGSIISMASYVVTSFFLYKIAKDITGTTLAGVIAAAVFALNPNVLYMQSTAMTELPLFACMGGMVYGVQRWIQTDHHKYLIGAGIASVLGTVTRYEAWVLLAALTAVVIYAAWRKGYTYARAEGTLLAFLVIAGAGIAGWLLWNWAIFGNPLYFQLGEYSRPSLWLGEDEPSYGNIGVALQSYYFAVVENIHRVGFVLMLVGLGFMAVKERLNAKILPTLAMTALFPFFVIALERGQRPLLVEQISGELYNVRFGLLMILPTAIAIGYLVSRLVANIAVKRTLSVAAISLSTLFLVWSVPPAGTIVTLKEPIEAMERTLGYTSDEVSAYLADNYDGGQILMESYGNELVLFRAGISTGTNVYEGSFQMWEPAVEDPRAHDISWIIIRHGYQPDELAPLRGTQQLESYELVFENSIYAVYEG